jgi:gas vesicle protein
MASKHRKAFVFGAFLGAAAGTAAAFWNAPQSGLRTRTQIQQAFEEVLFKALDMVPFENRPSDTVTETRAASAAAGDSVPVDIVLESRPSEATL